MKTIIRLQCVIEFVFVGCLAIGQNATLNSSPTTELVNYYKDVERGEKVEGELVGGDSCRVAFQNNDLKRALIFFFEKHHGFPSFLSVFVKSEKNRFQAELLIHILRYCPGWSKPSTGDHPRNFEQNERNLLAALILPALQQHLPDGKYGENIAHFEAGVLRLEAAIALEKLYFNGEVQKDIRSEILFPSPQKTIVSRPAEAAESLPSSDAANSSRPSNPVAIHPISSSGTEVAPSGSLYLGLGGIFLGLMLVVWAQRKFRTET